MKLVKFLSDVYKRQAENSGNIAAQGAHNHAGNNLVAIRDADHGIKRVGAQHRLYAVRDPVSYTHLDVYKRQIGTCRKRILTLMLLWI